jgi:hypoxanthine phosphoribosyltransferase
MPVARGGGEGSSPPARTQSLGPDAFEAACAELMRLVERDFAPGLLVGVRTGGLVVAEAMARSASIPMPVLPLTCRRPATGLKSRIPGLKAILASMPEPWLNALRQVEHRLLTGRRKIAAPPPVDQNEADAIGIWLANTPGAVRVLVADDAVDSGVTLATVLRTLRSVCPPATELRAAAITVTMENPAVEPDYALYRGVLCRFPWSFDAPR